MIGAKKEAAAEAFLGLAATATAAAAGELFLLPLLSDEVALPESDEASTGEAAWLSAATTRSANEVEVEDAAAAAAETAALRPLFFLLLLALVVRGRFDV